MSETPDKVVWQADLCKRLGRTSETLRQWVKAGKLPPADVALTRQSTGWKESTLRAAGINLP